MKKPQLQQITKLPLVELAGDQRVLVENHMGVLAYSDEEIQIKVCYGKVTVSGSNLRFMQMNSEQLVIKGCVENVQLVRR